MLKCSKESLRLLFIVTLSLPLISACGAKFNTNGLEVTTYSSVKMLNGTVCEKPYNRGVQESRIPPQNFLALYGSRPLYNQVNEYGLDRSDWMVKLGIYRCLQENDQLISTTPPNFSDDATLQFDFFKLPIPEIIPLLSNPDGKGFREVFFARGIFTDTTGGTVQYTWEFDKTNYYVGHFIVNWQQKILDAGYDLPGECHGFLNLECSLLNAQKYGIPFAH